MSFQSRSEAFVTTSRVPEWVWKRVPFHRTRDGESPTTKRAATVSWNHQLVTVGRSKALAAWDVRCTRAAVHQVLRSIVLQTPVNLKPEFSLDTLKNKCPANVFTCIASSRCNCRLISASFSSPASASSLCSFPDVSSPSAGDCFVAATDISLHHTAWNSLNSRKRKKCQKTLGKNTAWVKKPQLCWENAHF